MNLENLSVKDLLEHPFVPRSVKSFINRSLIDNYLDFIDQLYDDIDQIIIKIQENRELRQQEGEDLLTVEIKNLLNQLGYEASHDSKYGGHVDLVVKREQFLWLGEAKKHERGYDYLYQGFQQLCNRYSVAEENQDNGGLLIYIIKNKDANTVMQKWALHLAEKNLTDYESVSCPKRQLAFYSSHKHQDTGLPYKVRHMAVMLHFSPQDRIKRKK